MKVIVMTMGIGKIFYMTRVLRNSIQCHSSDYTTTTHFCVVSLSMCKGVLTALSYIITTIVFYLYSCVLSSPIIAYLTNRSFTKHLKLSKNQPKNCLAFVKSYVDKFKTYLGKQLCLSYSINNGNI